MLKIVIVRKFIFLLRKVSNNVSGIKTHLLTELRFLDIYLNKELECVSEKLSYCYRKVTVLQQ